MKRSFRQITIALALLMGLAACKDREYPALYGPDGQPLGQPGRLLVAPASTPPDQDAAFITGAGGHTWPITPGTPADVEAGTYTLLMVSPTGGLEIEAPYLSLSTTATDGELPQAPPFGTGVTTVTVWPDRLNPVAVNPTLSARQVLFQFTLNGNAVEGINQIGASLSGVARRIDATKGFGAVVPDGADQVYYTRTNTYPWQPGVVLPMRLLGIDGPQALLTVELYTASGTYTTTVDVTQPLSDFNRGNPALPAKVAIALQIMHLEGMTGTIEPWEEGPEIEIGT